MKIGYIYAFIGVFAACVHVAPGGYAASITGTATARVLSPTFNISCDALSFGNIKRVKSPGLITIAPNGKRNIRGNVTMGPTAHNASSCTVSGPANTNYTARAPRLVYFTAEGATPKRGQEETLYVSNIRIKSKNLHKAEGRVYRGQSDAYGQDELYLGATLYVPQNAAPGTYQGVVPVTIHY